MSQTDKYWKERISRRYSGFSELEELGEQAVRELQEKLNRAVALLRTINAHHQWEPEGVGDRPGNWYYLTSDEAHELSKYGEA